MEFKKIEIKEEFDIRNFRFVKVSETQAKMLATGIIKTIYPDQPVDPVYSQPKEASRTNTK